MKFPESERVRYSHNPLIEVICQIRFPKILKIEVEPPVLFQEAIRSQYPIFASNRAIELPPLLDSEQNLPLKDKGLTHQFLDKEQKWKVALASDFLAISTQEYRSWEEFRDRLCIAIELLIEHYSPSHWTRIGLRYLDLITRSELNLGDYSWCDLIKPQLVGVFSSHEFMEEDFVESLSTFACKLGYQEALIKVRHGLAQKSGSEELSYLIDSDFSTQLLTEINDVYELLDKFNREAGNFFRWCITERLQRSLQPEPIN